MWYCVTVNYTTADNRTLNYRIKNLSAKKLQEFRENVFAAGLYIPDPNFPGTEGTIVSPFRIGNIDVCMQATKFES